MASYKRRKINFSAKNAWTDARNKIKTWEKLAALKAQKDQQFDNSSANHSILNKEIDDSSNNDMNLDPTPSPSDLARSPPHHTLPTLPTNNINAFTYVNDIYSQV